MIINGNPAGNVMFWSKHLQREDTNERVDVKEIRGLTAEDIQNALWEMRWVAAGSRSQGNFMYQANINPLAHEHLTPDQWREAVDTLEKNLGLAGHQRVVIEHYKEGRQHYHVVWNRVDVDTMRVTDAKGNWKIHTRTARELETRFELTPIHERSREPGVRLHLWEQRNSERSGITPAEVTRQVTEVWRATDSGRALVAGLESIGFVVARGDRRDFCIVDRSGDVHSLPKRIEGVRTADVRTRMTDVQGDLLPTVDEARNQQRDRNGPEPRREVKVLREAYATSQTPEHFQKALEQQGYVLAKVDQLDAQHSRVSVNHAANRWELRVPLVEGQIVSISPNGFVHKLNLHSVGERAGDVKAFLKPLEAAGLLSVADARGKMPVRERPDRQTREPKLPTDRNNRGSQALMVADGAIDGIERLTSFVADFLLGAPKPAPRGLFEGEDILAVRRSDAALASIRRQIERDQPLRAKDIRNLTLDHLLDIQEKGDDYVRSLVRDMKNEIEKNRDRGRHRE